MTARRYSIWIEAEEWIPGQWTPHDGNTDVIITLEIQPRWAATFFSYQSVLSLAENNLSGEG
jgi:hypothetical protein